MNIDWLKFLPALALLLVPGTLFWRSKDIRYRHISRNWDQHWRRVLIHGAHVIDLGRAALGTWLLFQSLEPIPDPQGLAKYAAVFVPGSIRVFAVWVQTVACRNPDSVNAPFTFVAGTLLAGISPLGAVFALALSIPITMGLRSAAAFFPVVALAHLGLGVFFKDQALYRDFSSRQSPPCCRCSGRCCSTKNW